MSLRRLKFESMERLSLSPFYSPVSAISPNKHADSKDPQNQSLSATMGNCLTRARLFNAGQLEHCVSLAHRWDPLLSASSGHLFNLSRAARQKLRGYSGWPDPQGLLHIRTSSLRLVRRPLLVYNSCLSDRRTVTSGPTVGPKVSPCANWALAFRRSTRPE